MSVDVTQLKEYTDELEKVRKDFKDFLSKFITQIGEMTISLVKPRTPKDTGALQANWELGEVTVKDRDVSIEIKNPMEYASFVEYGHRVVINGVEVGWVEGRFMLKISIDEIQKRIPKLYEAQYKQFWDSIMGGGK